MNGLIAIIIVVTVALIGVWAATTDTDYNNIQYHVFPQSSH